MGLLTGGWGPRRYVLTGGLGERVAQTANPDLFNTPVADPANFNRFMGTDGDVEYATWTPRQDSPYNGRALEIFLPEAMVLPPASVDRLQRALHLMKPLTCTIRVSTTSGPERLKLVDPTDEVLE